MSCPDCSSGIGEMVLVEVTPREYANLRSEYMNKRRGVADYDWEVHSGQLQEIVVVDQSEYDSYNYFKYRREYEQMSECDVVDTENEVVQIRYNCNFVVSGTICLDCNYLYSMYLDNPQQSDIYDTNNGPWVNVRTM